MTSNEMRDWLLVLFGARTLLGGPSNKGVLSPIYELHSQVLPQGIAHMVTPVAWLAGIRGLVIPEGCIEVRVSALSKNEQRTLAAAVTKCEEVIGRIRAAESGLVLPNDAVGAGSPGRLM